MEFIPDYRHIADVMRNVRPARLPVYEHIVSPAIMERILNIEISSLSAGNRTDLAEFFRHYCLFFKEMTYDVVSFEVCALTAVPGRKALSGGKGQIQCRSDFEQFPWGDIPRRYWDSAQPQFSALAEALPHGMKVVGGVGNGLFEFAEGLVGLEYLPFMQVDDPELYSDLFTRIGDLLLSLWQELLRRHKDLFVACRVGDDMGFKSSLLTNPATIREQVLPQYRRIIDYIHSEGIPFLLHSCGCIFEVMQDLLDVGIDAKHSNEDCIAPFDRWIEDYGNRIGLLGGFDMDFLCSKSEAEVYTAVLEEGRRFRAAAKGYALGSGNSIPDYVPVENYLAMIRATQDIRKEEER